MAECECECEECEEGGEWMATFADLSTLMLTFFVLLLSFSNMDVVAFREMLGSVREAFGVQKQINGSIEAIASSPVELTLDQNDGAGMAPPHNEEIDANDEMLEQITKYVANAEMQDDVEIELTARGVVVRVKEGALYQSGSADLDDKSKLLLDNIAEMQRRYSDAMQIEGHTDNIPIKSRKYPSNWELWTARAIAALQYLKNEQGVGADEMGVAGYADSKPLGGNDTAEGRNRNRRVEFVFSRGPASEKRVSAAKGDKAAAAGKNGGASAAPANPSSNRAFAVPMSTRK
ncbi:MAG: OmpA family protein [Nannocystaceae bacterium]|nr:OmpA family protein [Nannocystaceae bacterium]